MAFRGLALPLCLLLAVAAVASAEAPAPAPGPSGNLTCTPLLDLLSNSPNFTLITAALKNSSLADQLAMPMAVPQYTLFAPLDSAMRDYLAAVNLTEAEFLAQPAFNNLLAYHVLPQLVYSPQMTSGLVLPTMLSNNPLTVELQQLGKSSDQTFATVFGFGTSGTLASYDIYSCQAVIHVINAVLLPKTELTFAQMFVRMIMDLPFYGTANVAAELAEIMQPGNVTYEVAEVMVGALQAGFVPQLGDVYNQTLALPNGANYLAQIATAAIWEGYQRYLTGPLATAVSAGYAPQVASVAEQMLAMASCPVFKSYVADATYGTYGIVTVSETAAGNLMAALNNVPSIQACLASNQAATLATQG